MAAPVASTARSLGRYQLVVELGKSHLGSLWAVRGPGDALYCLRRLPTAAVEAVQLQRLVDAASRATRLVHPNIGRVREVAQLGTELVVATDFAQGELLRSLLRLSNFLRKPFPAAVALKIAKDLLGALSHSEAQGISMSGGICPDSVLVEQSGLALLIDPCLSGQIQAEGLAAEAVDAVAYQAPESIAGGLSRAADIFSVGVLLWEMLTGGRRLFTGATRLTVLARLETLEIVELSGFKLPGGKRISPQVSAVVSRALNREPEKRFGSFAEMSAAIDATEVSLGVDEVQAFLKELAGNAILAREKLIGRCGTDNQSPAPPTAVTVATAQLAKPLATPPAPPVRDAAVAGKPARRTILGMAPPKPADVLRASQMVSHSEVEAIEPSIAAGPPIQRAPEPASEVEMASELLDALEREPSSSAASSEPFPPQAERSPTRPASATRPTTEEEQTLPISPVRLDEILTAIKGPELGGMDGETTDVDRRPSEHLLLGSLVREVLNTLPNEEGHTEQTKLSVGVVPGPARPKTKSLLWIAAALIACSALWLGWRLVVDENQNQAQASVPNAAKAPALPAVRPPVEKSEPVVPVPEDVVPASSSKVKPVVVAPPKRSAPVAPPIPEAKSKARPKPFMALPKPPPAPPKAVRPVVPKRAPQSRTPAPKTDFTPSGI